MFVADLHIVAVVELPPNRTCPDTSNPVNPNTVMLTVPVDARFVCKMEDAARESTLIARLALIIVAPASNVTAMFRYPPTPTLTAPVCLLVIDDIDVHLLPCAAVPLVRDRPELSPAVVATAITVTDVLPVVGMLLRITLDKSVDGVKASVLNARVTVPANVEVDITMLLPVVDVLVGATFFPFTAVDDTHPVDCTPLPPTRTHDDKDPTLP
jgi:hypothetical protein